MAILLCIGSMGNIRTTTMKAWTEAEGAKMRRVPEGAWKKRRVAEGY